MLQLVWHHGPVHDVYRPPLARSMAVGVIVVIAIAVVWLAADAGVRETVQLAPWLLLVALAAWAVFWRPCIEVSQGGVRLVNVTRTIDVPWPALQYVDTKWALRLGTAYGRYTAWAAPAPSARTVIRTVADRPMAERPDGAPLGAADIRPSSAKADTPSGDAALMIHRRWEQLRNDGFLDDPRLEHPRPPVRWHVEIGAAAAGLLAVGVAGLLV